MPALSVPPASASVRYVVFRDNPHNLVLIKPKNGFVLDNVGSALDKIGAVLDNFGNVSAYFGNEIRFINRVFNTKKKFSPVFPPEKNYFGYSMHHAKRYHKKFIGVGAGKGTVLRLMTFSDKIWPFSEHRVQTKTKGVETMKQNKMQKKRHKTFEESRTI